MVYTGEDIQARLDRIREKKRAYMTPRDYKEFMPASLGYEPRDIDTLMRDQLNDIERMGQQATELLQVKIQNKRDFQAMQRARREMRRARGQWMNAGKAGGGGGNLGGSVKNANGDLDFTTYSPSGNFNPFASMVTLKSPYGIRYTVNRTVAKRFQGFLKALKRTGYNVYSLGGYANRNIAGTGTKSLHAYGLAIDINPAQNPVTYGRPITNLPRGVGALAAKYGLVWGGNWNGSKKDTMHFSVPAFGNK